MSSSFFFYDLETTGVNARESRVMQFAGQRTDMDLNPVGEPFDILIKLTDDILPEPDAIMITGITPQKTLAEGITEAEFLKIFEKEIALPGTIFTGFNSVRFDDEFMRFMLYRNFYDAYEWQWKDSRSRWDLLDVVRMTRALRPEGIKWPFASDGKPTNRLELLTSLNGLDHESAHDALSDVHATISVAKLIREKQPKLFEFLLEMRDKKKVAALVGKPEPFVYASGKYSADYEKVAVVTNLGPHPDKQAVLVYDLRHDPSQFLDMKPEELAKIWRYNKDPDALRLPVKVLQFNRCPAVAPLGVINDENKERLKVSFDDIQKHRSILAADQDFISRLYQALKILDKESPYQSSLIADERNVDSQLYDGFIGDGDKQKSTKFRSADPAQINQLADAFSDARLKLLAPLYKARNYPKSLTDEERTVWEAYRASRLKSSLPKFATRLQALSTKPDITPEQQYILEELHLYAELVLPEL